MSYDVPGRSTQHQGSGNHDGAGAGASHERTPGKQSLTDALGPRPDVTLMVQAKDSSAEAAAPEQVHEAATHGTSGPGTALPHGKTIQRLFGRHDVSGITAHTDGNAAQGASAMGAAAFATGNRVAFANQPSLHTAAHEAAHVIQQRGGVQLKGAVGTAGDAHEQHADAVADRVVAGQSAEPLLDAYVGANVSGGAAGFAVQRMVTQIVPRQDKPDTIERIISAGRPERTHGASMGDHTTAFTLHVEGIRARLQGKTLAEAVPQLDELVNAVQTLPGFALVNDLPPAQKERVSKDWTWLSMIRSRPAVADPAHANSSTLALDLQDYISAYLSFRELIPLSTINVAAKSQGTAGKGKGESASVLTEHAGGAAKTGDQLLEAVVAMFDTKAAAMVAAELQPEMLQQMAPGLDAKPPAATGGAPDAKPAYEQRLSMMIEQHVQSVASSFPKVFAEDSGLTKKRVTDELVTRTLPLVLESWNKDRLEWDRNASSANKQEQRALEDMNLARPGTSNFENAGAEANKQATRAREQGALRGQADTSIAAIKARFPGLAPPPSSKKSEHKGKAPATDVPRGDAPADDERKQPLATQVRIDADNQIQDIESAGRSPSPFPGTMGAHTTAWVVHVDRVRSALRKKTVAVAIQTLDSELKTEAFAMANALTKQFTPNATHRGLLDGAKTALTTAIENAQGAPVQSQPALLQVAISALLTYINYIPGATLEATDTGGKSEGLHRRRLRGAEGGQEVEPKLLRSSILALLDVKVANDQQRQSLIDNHLLVIEKTYPTAYTKADPGSLKRIAKRVLRRRDDESDKVKESSESRKRGRGDHDVGRSETKKFHGEDDVDSDATGVDEIADESALTESEAMTESLDVVMDGPLTFDFTTFGG